MSRPPQPIQTGHSNTVSVGAPGGEDFKCDEEPNVLGPENGFGYFPARFGQKIEEGKLEIVRKLGWAQNSTVWIARTHDPSYTSRFVAVKILTLNTSVGHYEGHLFETDMLELVTKNKANNPGWRYCLRFYNSFLENSKYGPHICIVTEVLGGNLVSLQKAVGGKLSLQTVKRITKQTLCALDYLHRVCKVVHTDIKPDNVLIYVPNVDAVIEESLRTHSSAMYSARIEPSLSPEPILTAMSQPLRLDGKTLDLQTIEIRLADFGEAQSIGKRNLDPVQPLQLRAPEVILGYPWGAAIDIWSIGCLTFEYLTRSALFHRDFSNHPTDDIKHLKQMMDIAGKKFPQNFLSRCKPSAVIGEAINQYQPQSHPLEMSLRQFRTMKEEDIVPAAAFIRRCLEHDPQLRPTADALLRDSWFTGI